MNLRHDTIACEHKFISEHIGFIIYKTNIYPPDKIPRISQQRSTPTSIKSNKYAFEGALVFRIIKFNIRKFH